MSGKIVGIVGSYRKDCIIDSLVSEVLSAAEERGAETSKIYLIDKHIGFCSNCRSCTQLEGTGYGQCVQDDGMEEILMELESADAIVIGAPVNFFNLNAVTRQFMERLVCYAYWPWGKQGGPSIRASEKKKKAVLITSSAMPGIMGRIFTGAMRALKIMAKMLGAKPVATIFVGMIAVDEKQRLSGSALKKARKAGQKITS